MIDSNQKDWDSALSYVMAAYRSSKHDFTGYTPNMLMFGREVRAPADLVYGTPTMPDPKTVDELEDRLKRAYSKVRENVGAATLQTSDTMI